MSKVLNITGILLMIAIIAILLILNAPRLMGYQIYGVLSDSMEPSFPTGSVIYAKEINPEEIVSGDVIVFPYSSGSEMVIAHRVTQIQKEEQSFITKGDANESEDVYPVSYDNLLGKVFFCIPLLGTIFQFLQTVLGKFICIAVFATVFVMWVIADRLKVKENY